MASSEPSLSRLRLLILSPALGGTDIPSPFPPVLTQLTSIPPSEDLETFAGYTSHAPLQLRTKYYSKDVSIWCDELPSEPAKSSSEVAAADRIEHEISSPEGGNLGEWKEQMLSAAAGEVRAVIGGIIIILHVDTNKVSTTGLMKYIEAAHAFREAIEDESPGRDIASIVILQPQSIPKASNDASPKMFKDLAETAEKVSNNCLENDMFGWDVVAWTGRAESLQVDSATTDERNEFGEKVGMPRVLEVLQGIDWSAGPAEDDDAAAGVDSDDNADVVGGRSRAGLDDELQQEMLGLKLSMLEDTAQTEEEDSGEDLSMEQMNSLKSRVLAIRDTVAGMPPAQKEAFAKREIDRIMKEL